MLTTLIQFLRQLLDPRPMTGVNHRAKHHRSQARRVSAKRRER